MMCGSDDPAQILCNFSKKLEKNREKTKSALRNSLPAPSIPNRVPSKSRYGRKLSTVDGQRGEPS